MKKILLATFLYFSICFVKAQVVSISPSSAFRGQTLTTTITMANGVMFNSSASLGTNDIYLQQGATTIFTDFYTWPMGLPPFFDDLFTADFTIPTGAPFGWYDVHVITYDNSQPWLGSIPVDNILANGFLVPQVNSCPVPTGVSASAITNTTATINWVSPTVADTFRIRYKTATSGYFYKDVNGSGGLTSTSFNNLSPGETYFFDVSTICNGGISSTYSVPVLSFTTGTTVVPCIRPYSLSTTGITNTSATILWTNYVTADTFRIRYSVFGSGIVQYLDVNGSGGSTATLNNLQANTQYTYQVSSICSSVSSGYSFTGFFTTLSTPVACARPHNVSSSNVTNVSALISWTNMVSADTFRIRYNVQGSFSFMYFNQVGTAGNSATLTGLYPNTTYYFSVSSICSGVSSGYCGSNSFTTLPALVSCVIPTGLATSNITNNSADISWSQYVSADTFLVRYSVNGTTNYIWKKVPGTAGNTTTLTGLAANTTYQWQVRSVCIANPLSSYSAPQIFGTPLRTRKPDVAENSFVVYPNPANDKVSISIDEILNEKQHSIIAIYDLSGRLILEKEIEIVSGKNLFEFDVEFLSSGMYLLKVGDEKILLNKN